MCDFASEYHARPVDNSRRTRERYDATTRPRPAGQAHLRVFLVNMIGSAAYPDNLIFVEIRSLIFIIGIRKKVVDEGIGLKLLACFWEYRIIFMGVSLEDGSSYERECVHFEECYFHFYILQCFLLRYKIQTVDACDLQVEFQPLETFS